MATTYYKAVEYVELNGEKRGMALNKKEPNGGWTYKFKTLEEAKQEIEKAIRGRQTQMFYWRDKNDKIVDKISYYDRYPLEYKVYKIVEEKEEMYSSDNSNIKLREPGNRNLQEETTI